MRYLVLIVSLTVLVMPIHAAAQARLMAGVGLSTPVGDFGDVAETGWHAMAGLQLSVPSIPIAARADGAYHSFGEAPGGPSPSMLTGALSLVFNLPGVGLVPYFLGGAGAYRTSVEGSNAVSDNGLHGGFGVNIGALGFGGFGEVRFINVNQRSGDARFVTATLGVRL
jgi:hypothetical protein